MSRYGLVIIFIASCLFSFGCGQNRTVETIRSEVAVPREQQIVADRIQVDFEGVSFSYDPSIFGKVKSEIVPEYKLPEPDDKPDGVEPECRCFTFELGDEYQKAALRVYPLNRFPEVYALNRRSVGLMKKEIEGLKNVLGDVAYRLDGHIPHLRFADASNNFYVKVRHFGFSGGKGIIFVTHWTHGADLFSNRNLIYQFEGITDDGSTYVTAEMPLKVKFLPDEPPTEFEGYTYENLFESYKNKEGEKRFKVYVKSITDRLEKTHPREFAPPLKSFEELIASLKVTKN